MCNFRPLKEKQAVLERTALSDYSKPSELSRRLEDGKENDQELAGLRRKFAIASAAISSQASLACLRRVKKSAKIAEQFVASTPPVTGSR